MKSQKKCDIQQVIIRITVINMRYLFIKRSRPHIYIFDVCVIYYLLPDHEYLKEQQKGYE